MMDVLTEANQLRKFLNNWLKFGMAVFAYSLHLPYFLVAVYVNTVGFLLRFFFTRREESLLNEVVVLVGAGKSPVGVQLAMQLANANAKVVLIDKDSDGKYDPLVRKIKENGEMAFFYECEVTDKYSVINTMDAIEKDVGKITMMLHGSLLLDNASDRDLVYSYIHLVDAVLPRMQATEKGHMVFLSLINGSTDYRHHNFVQGFFESILSDVRVLRGRGIKMSMSLVNVHRKILTELSTDYMKFGIFGTAEASTVASQIIKGVRQKKLYISMPSYMTHMPQFLKVLPRRVVDTVVDLMYRIY